MGSIPTALVLGRVIETEIADTGLRARLVRLDRPSQIETDWIAIASPMVGPEAGLIFAPEVGDLAVLAFTAKKPIILGFLNGGRMTAPSDVLEERIIQSRDDNAIILIDGDDGGITLRDKNGNEIVMNQDGITIRSDGDINIEAGGTTTVKGATVELNP